MRTRSLILLVIAFTIVVGVAAPTSAATSAGVTATLKPGMSGPAVAELQNRLTAGGYWLGAVDGRYSTLTQQAVMAFQKANGLSRDGVYGPITRRALETEPRRPVARSRSGLVVEIDKGRQILMVVRNGRVEQTFNTSTGSGRTYRSSDGASVASTPSGTFKVYRQIDGIRVAELGELYRPKYFNGGIAIHGSPNVPAFPASHGCARLTNAAMDWMWSSTGVPLGTPVWVY